MRPTKRYAAVVRNQFPIGVNENASDNATI
jgi:hypothetical protein